MITLHCTPLYEGFAFLEGPRWSGGRLWISDLFKRTVLAVDPAGTVETVAEIPGVPSGIGFLPDGRPLLVSMQDRTVRRVESDGSVTVHADLTGLVGTDSTLNDMVVGPDGWAYVGNIGYDSVNGAAPRPGDLVLVSAEGEVGPAGSGKLELPNGCGISPDGTRLVASESMAHRLVTWTIGPDHRLSERKVLASLPGQLPDGLTVDAEGAVWVAAFEGKAFLRVAADGTLTHRVPTGARRAVSCTLGGADGRTLFCLTADTSLEDLARGRAESRVETVEVEVPGAGSP